MVDGIRQKPIEGVSIVYTFDNVYPLDNSKFQRAIAPRPRPVAG